MTTNCAEDLIAIFQKFSVPDAFQTFCNNNRCTSVQAFSMTAAKEELIDDKLIDPSGIQLDFGGRIAVRMAWGACRALYDPSNSSAPSSSARSGSKMPDGVEARYRNLWKTAHGFNLSGAWLVHEDLMKKIYDGIIADPMYLHVPDTTTIVRKCNLSQKPTKGTLLTEGGTVEQVDHFLSPSTNLPDLFLRLRAYIMTVCFLVINKPDWFPYERALELTDFLFDSINLRPDGRKPNLACVNSCYLAMFGDYATRLQNERMSLEAWLAQAANWQHYWKDSVTGFESGSSGSASAAVPIQDDLRAMVSTNRNLMDKFAHKIDNLERSFSKGGGKPSKKGGNRWGNRGNNNWNNNNNSTNRGGKGSNGGADSSAGGSGGGGNGGAAKRTISVGRGAWNKRSNKKQRGGAGGGKAGK